MHLQAIRTPVIRPGDDIASVLVNCLEEQGIKLHPRDVIVVAETVMATAQRRIVDLDTITDVPPVAEALARKHRMDPRLVNLVMQESDEILGGVDHVLLARKDGLLLANAGIDASNSGGENMVSLLPASPWEATSAFRHAVERMTGVSPLCAILADSRVQPLKRGVIGGAIAVSGFQPIEDKRGQRDLFGRPLVITQVAVADDLTSAAEILMGEADEQTPFVLIRGAPVTIVSDDRIDRASMLMPEDECLFVNVFKHWKNG